MGSPTVHRYRPTGGAIGTLDLTDAAAANRRFETTSATLPKNHALKAFRIKKSAAQATDVQIYEVDRADSDALILLEEMLGSTEVDIEWTPPHGEAIAGYDVHNPAADAQRIDYRVQFGQAGAACTAKVKAIFKEV